MFPKPFSVNVRQTSVPLLSFSWRTTIILFGKFLNLSRAQKWFYLLIHPWGNETDPTIWKSLNSWCGLLPSPRISIKITFYFSRLNIDFKVSSCLPVRQNKLSEKDPNFSCGFAVIGLLLILTAWGIVVEYPRSG